MLDLKPGIYHDINNYDYHHKIDAVSNSYLGMLNNVPAKAKLPQGDTESLKFGRAFHAYILEKRVFAEEFVVVPEFPTKPTSRSTAKTIKEWDWWIKSFEGREPLAVEDFVVIQRMEQALLFHPSAAKFLKDGVSETTIIWKDEETGLMCKVRPDRIPSGNKGVIFDLKSTSNAASYSFQTDCVKYGYAREGAMYLEGFSIVSGTTYLDLIFACLAVEKEPPYRVEVYTIEPDFLEWGHGEFHRLLQVEKVCRENNFYPHYNNAGVESLFKPGYLKIWEFEQIEETQKVFTKGKNK